MFALITDKVLNRFWSKVNKTDTCWLWTASSRTDGYGVIGIEGKTKSAHRVSWQLTYGDIPDGLYVCHHCDNKLCVNPNHLFLGTAKDNTQDMIQKGRRGGCYRLEGWMVPIIRKMLTSASKSGRGLWTHKRIGEIFNVSRNTISNISINTTWRKAC